MGLFSKNSHSYDDGKRLIEKGEYKLAIYEFDKCIESQGYDSYILQYKAFCLMQLEEYDQAIECYEIILEDYNYDLDRMVLNNIGIAYNKINKPNKAIEYFDEGITYYPDYIDFWINKGVSLIELEKYEESLECYEEALNLDFLNKEANEGYNYLCEKLGIEGEDFFDLKNLFYNKNHDSISGLSAASYIEGKKSFSENREDEIEDDFLLDDFSDEDLDKLHMEFDDLNKFPIDNDVARDSSFEKINESSGGFIFCQNCGTKLNEEDIFCSKCGTRLNKYISCSNCGTKLREDAVFCKNCGKKLK